jgi:hypothetical protein
MRRFSEAETFLLEVAPGIRQLAEAAHTILEGEGCTSYVKTIYVGYEIDGDMVAALYAHPNHLEIALALPEDEVGDSLVDASHLTWRTMPVAAIIRDEQDLEEFGELVAKSAEGVRTHEHTVLRDNEYFMKSRRERRGL